MENINHIFYINLETRTDRRQELEEEFRKMRLWEDARLERFPGIPTPGFGILGCTMSHCEVFKLAIERGYDNILILEDDFTFRIGREEFDAILQEIFPKGDDGGESGEASGEASGRTAVEFDVIMFAYNLKDAQPSDKYPFLYRVRDASTASCYLIHRRAFRKIVELYECVIPLLRDTKEHWNYANDAVWRSLMETGEWYATATRVGVQRPSFSDNSGEFMDHGC